MLFSCLQAPGKRRSCAPVLVLLFGLFVSFALGAGRSDSRISLISADAVSVTLEIRLDSFQTQEVTVDGIPYQRLILPQTTTTTALGEPELPTLGQFVAIPPGSQVSYEILLDEQVVLPGYRIYPTQKPLIDKTGAAQQPFMLLSSAYERSTSYPADLIQISEVQTIRDMTVIHVLVHPLQYRASRNELIHHQALQVRLQFYSPKTIEGYFRPEKTDTDETFQEIYDNLIINYETALQYPLSTPEHAVPEAVVGAEFLIITNPAYTEAAQKLATWKIRRGISTLVRTTATTGTTAASIKSYIQSAYNTWTPKPSYVLFLGDANQIPTHYVTTHPSAGDDYPSGFKTGTDLYYATMGGASDRLPDIHLGRIPVDTITEANHVVDKIINYESNPTTSSDFYSTMLMMAYFQDRYTNTTGNPPPDKTEDRLFVRTTEDVRDYVSTLGYTMPRIYNTEAAKDPRWYNDGTAIPAALRKPGFAWNGSTADITNGVNSGAFILFYRGHGSATGWAEPSYYIDEISDWNNGDRLPVVFSTTCETGWFDAETDGLSASTRDPSFGERLLRFGSAGQKGSVGVYAATRISFSWHNDALIKGFMDSIWPSFLGYTGSSPSSSRKTGSILSYGKYYYASVYGTTDAGAITTLELFHYFGDPTMRLWTVEPHTMLVTHAATAAYGASSFPVTVNTSSAKITLSQNGVILGTDSTPWYAFAGDTVHVALSPAMGADEAYLTVTKDNYRPYLRRIIVRPSGPTNLHSDAQSKTQIWLDWTDHSSSEQAFRIERSANGLSGWTQIGTTGANDTTYVDSRLTCGTDYYYRVQASNDAGNSPYSNALKTSTIDCVSAVPSNLRLSNITQTAITLNWGDNSDNESGFHIERSTEIVRFSEIASVQANVVTYTNTGLQCDTTYFYRVRSFNAGGTSAYTNTASSKTLECSPAAPTNLTATGLSQSQIGLKWTDNSSNETGFEIYTQSGLSWIKMDTVGPNITAYTDIIRGCNTSVTYRIRAINSGGSSGYSNTATGTTTPCVPAAPERLEARTLSKTEIFLRWIDNSKIETSFKIESLSGREWVTVGTARADDTDWTLSQLLCGTTYSLRVSACNAVGCSAPTNTAKTTTFDCALGAPTNLTASAASSTQINLNWTDNAANETGFKIERSLDGTSEWVSIGSVGPNIVAYSNSNLQPDTMYYYRVYAYTTTTSPYSNVARAKTGLVAESLLEFPQIAVGGNWRSFLFLTNPTDGAIKGRVNFFQGDGTPLVVNIEGASVSSREFMVIPDASVKLDLLGVGRAVQVGWCRVTADGPLGGLLIYQMMEGDIATSQATVLPSVRLRKFRLPLAYLRERTDIGLAIANPLEKPTQIVMQYISVDGSSSAAGVPFILDSLNQVARFASQFLPGLPDNAQGVVEVVSDADIVAVGLAFINNYAVFTTIPVVPVP